MRRLALAALALGNLLLKLAIVAYALISAGVRYTVVGVILALALTAVALKVLPLLPRSLADGDIAPVSSGNA